VREYATDMLRLANDLGGFDALSEQQIWLIEEAAFWHCRLVANREAVLSGRQPLLTYGEHQNGASTLMGHLKTLGLGRVARLIPTVPSYLAARSASAGTTT
jgi:hypothetical protein